MVISGNEQASDFESKLEELHPSWLYKNLDSFLSEVKGYFSSLLGNFFQNFNERKAYWTEYMLMNIRRDSPHKSVIVGATASIQTTNGHVALLYANNNYWKNQVNININTDLGSSIFYQAVYQETPRAVINVVAKLDENVDLFISANSFLPNWSVEGNDIDGELYPITYYPYLVGARDNVSSEFALAFYDTKKQLELSQETESMPDSIRIKEIHEALQAEKFCKDDDNPQERRVANLGYYIERIARVLGISVNSNGTIRSIRQSKWLPQGATIPPGWSIGQWGTNGGEQRRTVWGQQGRGEGRISL
ncbi:MAG: hypothetical protein HC820_01800 [Hydrococcus sp. RM1_1_31]|nr:hypothetical protein [Hydrococcus sp. RM1_1_31]